MWRKSGAQCQYCSFFQMFWSHMMFFCDCCILYVDRSSWFLRLISLSLSIQIVTRGCETTEMTLRRNGLGQLGFHVNFEGIVADVEPFGYAWKAGLRQGSRLVEICKVAVATLTHEQMIDLLRTSITVKVVIIQPYEDGAPRRYPWSLLSITLSKAMSDINTRPFPFFSWLLLCFET